jgi:hypothetical protein
MKKPTKGRVETTDAEIDAAIERAKEWELYRPVATAVDYDAETDELAISFKSGVKLLVPRKLLQGLENAVPALVANVAIGDYGARLHWRKLNVSHYVPYLLEGVFGNRRWQSEVARKGGLVRSEAKARAARRNGSKGGRPRAPAALALNHDREERSPGRRASSKAPADARGAAAQDSFGGVR